MQEIVGLGLILNGWAWRVPWLSTFQGEPGLRQVEPGGKSTGAGTHVSLLAAMLFLLLGATPGLNRFHLLYSKHELMSGANYSDLNGRLPLLSVLAAGALLGAVLWVYNAFSCQGTGRDRGGRNLLMVLLAFIVYRSSCRNSWWPERAGEGVGRRSSTPSARRSGLQSHGCRRAEPVWGQAIAPEDIRANANTIRSIRLWTTSPCWTPSARSRRSALTTIFVSVTTTGTRCTASTADDAVAGELDSVSLPERNWINEHLSYTHGYGVTLGPVNRVTPEGLPLLLVQDIPPRAQEPVLHVARPEIYYGELTRGYVVVKTDAKEFDYPSGEENVYSTYDGAGASR